MLLLLLFVCCVVVIGVIVCCACVVILVSNSKPMISKREGGHSRLGSEKAVLGMVNHNIKAMLLRLPGFVYGNNGSFFIPFAIQNAKRDKVAYYAGKIPY